MLDVLMNNKRNIGIFVVARYDTGLSRVSGFDGSDSASHRNRIVMANKALEPDTPQKPFFVSIGNFLAVSYWIIEAYFDSVLIENTTFAMRLFPSDPNELWMRSLVSVLFVGFGLYAHVTHGRIKAVEKMNKDAAWLLKNALSNTIRGHFPICAYCNKIRDENSQWIAPDRFIASRTEAEFSQDVCDKCQTEHR